MKQRKLRPCLTGDGMHVINVVASVFFFSFFLDSWELLLQINIHFLFCSTLGQGLQTSTCPGEILFSIAIAIFGLILFALLIGNMQTYLQSLTIRLEEMRIKRRDSEQWMHHRALPQDLRERVRRYDQYKWLETRGVDEENIVQSLPKDLRRDIKRHLCLNLVRRVPLFANMEERLLDAICFLKEGDFCGEELLTWALNPKAGSNLPSSTRTVKALNEVEAFALEAEELKFVSSQFRRLHSRQVQHTFQFYSQQWRTWASSFIQTAWRKYSKRKYAELRRKEEEGELDYNDEQSLVGKSDNTAESHSLGATIFASCFAANLRGHKNRGTTSSLSLIKVPKPPEPDFNDLDTDELGDKIE
ncbi:hypothetical protein CRYUN_Cryun34aG0097400 [Craigia yunnanensis]